MNHLQRVYIFKTKKYKQCSINDIYSAGLPSRPDPSGAWNLDNPLQVILKVSRLSFKVSF